MLLTDQRVIYSALLPLLLCNPEEPRDESTRRRNFWPRENTCASYGWIQRATRRSSILSAASSIITAHLGAAVCPSNRCCIKRRSRYSGKHDRSYADTQDGDSSKDWIAKRTRPCLSDKVQFAQRRRACISATGGTMDQRVAHGECFIPASNYANVLRVSNVCVRLPPPPPPPTVSSLCRCTVLHNREKLIYRAGTCLCMCCCLLDFYN